MSQESESSWLTQLREIVDEDAERFFREEERGCDASDKTKRADIAFRRRRSEAMRVRSKNAQAALEQNPGRYMTADILRRVVSSLQDRQWAEAHSLLMDVEVIKQDLEFWKELAREAVRAARSAGADLSNLRNVFPPLMAELDAEDTNDQPF